MPVEKKSYSVNVQMILAIIPIVDLWAAYRIEKLRLWVLYWIGMLLISTALMELGDPLVEFIIAMAIEIPIAVFLMRHFTMEWNKEIDHPSSHDESFS